MDVEIGVAGATEAIAEATEREAVEVAEIIVVAMTKNENEAAVEAEVVAEDAAVIGSMTKKRNSKSQTKVQTRSIILPHQKKHLLRSE